MLGQSLEPVESLIFEAAYQVMINIMCKLILKVAVLTLDDLSQFLLRLQPIAYLHLQLCDLVIQLGNILRLNHHLIQILDLITVFRSGLLHISCVVEHNLKLIQLFADFFSNWSILYFKCE